MVCALLSLVVRRLFRNASSVGYPRFCVSQARVFVVLGCSGTVEVLSASWTPSFSGRVVVRLRERRQWDSDILVYELSLARLQSVRGRRIWIWTLIGYRYPGPLQIDPGSASRYITTLVHAHIPGPVDAWREFPVPVRDLLYDMFTRRYVFTRPEDLPRARAVWESTTQTNLRKSMYEARDKE
ncbi:hypothetical protein Taro_033491 [Colocasia esculenta]|uniref:Uncharacterized protein n=1 Tax=Colocasia esculenta TaxID=4460 RepID=A0A843WCM9_COLES|nr:hypothetical protein [Colocasia esculenta]